MNIEQRLSNLKCNDEDDTKKSMTTKDDTMRIVEVALKLNHFILF